MIGIDKNNILPRCGHQSVISGNQLFIFGGMNNNSYIGSSMFIINLIPDTFNFIHKDLDDVDNTDVQRFKNDLCNYLNGNLEELMKKLDDGGSLSDDDKKSLNDAISTFKKTF